MKVPLMTTKEITQLLKVSRNTVNRIVKEFDIPYLQVGRQRRFEMSRFVSFLEGNRSDNQVKVE